MLLLGCVLQDGEWEGWKLTKIFPLHKLEVPDVQYLLSIQGTLMEEARPQTFINSYAIYLQKIFKVTKAITEMTHRYTPYISNQNSHLQF